MNERQSRKDDGAPTRREAVILNERQQEAVEATEGRVRIVAGAGSGKTRVLAHRFAYIVNELGVSPGNVLCLTFTNKAAQEMKQRISTLVDRGSVNDFICTIHSFCVKFLRREIYRVGYPKSFQIIDEEDGKVLAKQAMEEFGIDRKRNTAERFLSQVAAFKGADPDRYILRWLLPGGDKTPVDAVTRYIGLQLKQFVLDYDDLLCLTLYILKHFEEARSYWTEKLNYVMVDEVQDCSADDWKLLNAIAAYHQNIFVVGDPDQAIYEWRGANPKIFIDFRADTDIILDRNYRSTPDVLGVANGIIAHNKNRIPKDLYTAELNDVPAVWRHCTSEREEADKVAEEIERGLKEGKSASDYAVLYRASHLSRQIEQGLLKRKIPYSMWGGVRFFERREIKDVLAYLRLAANEDDDLSFVRTVNVPSRRFGARTLKHLREIAEAEGTGLMSALRRHIDERPFARRELKDYIAVIDSAREQALAALPVSEIADGVLKATGLLDELRQDEEEERLENIAELINSMKEFERLNEEADDKSLTSYLQDIALYTNADCQTDTKRVRLMTIHQSKGLEFDTVFIIGLTEGVFPSHRTIRERRKDGEEEERRLMYVAVTRARRRLILSDSQGYLNDNGALKYPSRFIGEIPEEYLDTEGPVDPELLRGTRNLVARLDEELGEKSDAPMSVGSRVRHKVFGEGVIEQYDPGAGSYRVKFAKGIRNLLGRVLEPID